MRKEGELNPQISKAMSKEEAIAQLSSLPGAAVELEYDARSDLRELLELSRQHGVGIIFKTQECILVESLQALERGLAAEKTTWRQRFLYCAFSLGLVPANTAKDLYTRASELDDTIVPADTLPSIYSYWKN
jgi:hypothetical protein